MDGVTGEPGQPCGMVHPHHPKKIIQKKPGSISSAAAAWQQGAVAALLSRKRSVCFSSEGGMGKGARLAPGSWGGGAAGAPAGHSAAAPLPAPGEKLAVRCKCGTTWEGSGRKQSELNAPPSEVAREQRKPSGERLLRAPEGKAAAEAEERGLPLRAVPGPGGAAHRGAAIPPLPFLPSRAKDLKTRLGILLHKPELGHRIGTSSRLQLGSRRR